MGNRAVGTEASATEAGDRPDDSVTGLVRGATAALAIQAMATVLSYSSQVFLARWLGVSEYGLYTYALTWGTLLASLAGLGIPAAAPRFIPEYLVARDWARLRGFVRAAWVTVFVSAVGTALLGTALVLLIGGVLRHRGDLLSLVLGVWLTPALALLGLQAEFCRSVRRLWLAYTPGRLLRPVLTIGVVYLASVRGATSAAELLALVLAMLAGLLAFQLALIPRAFCSGSLRGTAIYERSQWLRVSIAFLWLGGFTIILSHTDIIMIGFFMERSQVGIYGAAARTAVVIGYVLIASNTVLAPTISALYHGKGKQDLQLRLRWVSHAVFWPTLVAAVLLLVCSKYVLGLFGAEFIDAGVPIVAVLAVGQLINAACGPVAYLHNMTGHQRLTIRVFAVSAAVNIVLNAVLIPKLGLLGAAIATSSTMALWNVWLVYLAVHVIGVNPSVFALMKRS